MPILTRPWKRGTAAARAANTTVPPAGEVGVETDTGNIVVTDGTSTWAALKRLVRLDEVTTAVQQYVTTLVVTNSSLTAIANESGYVWALVDNAGRVAFGVKLDGTAVGKFTFAAGSVMLNSLGTDVTALLPQSMPVESGYVWGLVGNAGRIALGVKADGTVVIPKSSIAAYSLRAAENPSYIAQPFIDSSSRYQIRVTRKSDAKITIVTADSWNNVEPFLTEDNKLLFRSDSTGTMTGYWRAADGTGAAWRVTPTTDLYAPGDSLTHGTGTSDLANAYPDVLAARLGVTVYNGGVGGTKGDSIAARANGQPLTLTGDVTVPADTSSVTLPVSTSAASAGTYTFGGTLGTIPGTVTCDGTAYTFARTTAGASTVVPSGTQFITTQGVLSQENTLSIWLGRNSFTSDTPAATVAQIQSIIDYHKSYIKRFAVLEIPPATGDPTGSGSRAQLDATNAAIAAQWPNNFVAVATYLRSDQAFTDAAISKTSQDITDIGNGVTPTSFRADSIHLNDTGYLLVAKYVESFMRAKGWYS